jgi:hypothetical protein
MVFGFSKYPGDKSQHAIVPNVRFKRLAGMACGLPVLTEAQIHLAEQHKPIDVIGMALDKGRQYCHGFLEPILVQIAQREEVERNPVRRIELKSGTAGLPCLFVVFLRKVLLPFRDERTEVGDFAVLVIVGAHD